MVVADLEQVLHQLALIKKVFGAFEVIFVEVGEVAGLRVRVDANLRIFPVGSVHLRLVDGVLEQLEAVVD